MLGDHHRNQCWRFSDPNAMSSLKFSRFIILQSRTKSTSNGLRTHARQEQGTTILDATAGPQHSHDVPLTLGHMPYLG